MIVTAGGKMRKPGHGGQGGQQEAAAEQARTNLSDFVRRRALEAAETDLLNRRIVTIAAKDWARFEAWASAPAREVPALRKLSKTRPVWQK